MKIAVINGPNLNLLGIREKSIYGDQGFESYFETLKDKFPTVELSYYQSNVEGELINHLHSLIGNVDGAIINAGAYTHTSIAIRDAIAGVTYPVIEVHISNTLTREEFRHKSVIGPVCKGAIMGFGLDSYRLGIESLKQ